MSNKPDNITTKNSMPTWRQFETFWLKKFNRRPYKETVLFVIGLQESKGLHLDCTNEEKQNIIAFAKVLLLSEEGFYKAEKSTEAEEIPTFRKLKDFDALSPQTQEIILRKVIIRYFFKQKLI